MPTTRFAFLRAAIDMLPDAAKTGVSLATVIGVIGAVLISTVSAFKMPARLDAHIAQMDTLRRESAVRDSALLREIAEGNRLARCGMIYESHVARLACVVKSIP